MSVNMITSRFEG